MAAEPLRILVLSTFDGTNASTIRDFLFSFRAYSRHQYFYIFDCRGLDANTDFDRFDVIMVFWSLHDIASDLSEEVRTRIGAARACKVMFIQDEYRAVRTMNRAMAELGLNVMFTCVDPRDHDTFYPRAIIPTLDGVYTVLTGYVPEYLERGIADLSRPRPFDITFRSRDVPYYLGDLAQHKRILAQRFPEIAETHGLTHDISIREHDRLYGRRWTDFLLSSRCVLGSPSGASVVDFTGLIRRNCDRHLALHPSASYAEVKRRFFADVDGQVVIDSISPRVFEAAALGATLVQVEGPYSGMLVPDVHYIKVAADYSNVAEVMDRVKDHTFCRQLAARTRDDLIASGKYSYREFVERFDAIIDSHVTGRRGTPRMTPAGFYARAYARDGQAIVPWKTGFVVLPSSRLVLRIVSRGLARVAAPAGRLPAQLIDNPAELAVRLVHAMRVLRRSASLRTILRYYVRTPGARVTGLYEFMNELVKMDILSRVRADVLDCREPFGLNVSYDDEECALDLTSHRRPGSRRVPLAPSVATALRAGTIRAIIWDHTAVGMQVVYRVSAHRSRTGIRFRPFAYVPVRVGPSGLFHFAALTALARMSPDTVGTALAHLLEP